jgi:hypothetical protein
MIEIGLVPIGYFVSEIPDNMTVDLATMLQLLFLN